MKPKVLSIGILGCANIAERYLIPSILELRDKFVIKGIASRSKNKVNDLASKFKLTPFYSYKDLIETENLNAIYIPLPNSLHAEWIEKSINNGLHVLVEKSLGCSLQEVKKLNDLALKKDLALIENFQFRFHPQIKKITDLLEKGVIGELRTIRSSFGFPPFKDKDNIRYKKELGGGALLDAGAYPIKISQIFMGNNISVKAASLTMDKYLGVDLWGGGFLKQDNGHAFSEISFGFDNFYQCNIELWGSKGKISTDRVFTAPPGFKTNILVENANARKKISVKESNHFINMLLFFYNCTLDKKMRTEEYKLNINQARLIEEFKNKANEK